jgi:hypothetical protein
METDQEFVQPFMMQPPFMPSDQFPFNYQPNVRGTLLVKLITIS